MVVGGDRGWFTDGDRGWFTSGDLGFVFAMGWVLDRRICLLLEWVLRVVIVNGEFVLALGWIWFPC